MPLGPLTADDKVRASRRAGIQLQADKVVLQQTRNRRDVLLTEFDCWLGEKLRTIVEAMLSGQAYDPEAISEALVSYGKDLYNAGRSYSKYAEIINALTARKPGLRRLLASVWDLAFNWVVDEPHEHNAALPLSLVLAISSLAMMAMMWGWFREASIFVMGWVGVLRIGEILQAKRSDLALPRDAAPGVWYALLKIQLPKTRGRAARHQSSRIDLVDVVEMLSAAFGSMSPDVPLWHLFPSTLRKDFFFIVSCTWPHSSWQTWKVLILSGITQARWCHVLVADNRGQRVCQTQGTLDLVKGT